MADTLLAEALNHGLDRIGVAIEWRSPSGSLLATGVAIPVQHDRVVARLGLSVDAIGNDRYFGALARRSDIPELALQRNARWVLWPADPTRRVEFLVRPIQGNAAWEPADPYGVALRVFGVVVRS